MSVRSSDSKTETFTSFGNALVTKIATNYASQLKQRNEKQFSKFVTSVITSSNSAAIGKQEEKLPAPMPAGSEPPSVFDIQNFIRYHLPQGLYGVDEFGNHLTREQSINVDEVADVGAF